MVYSLWPARDVAKHIHGRNVPALLLTLRFERGNLNGITPYMIDELVAKYPRRDKKCECCSGECDCVLFGMYEDYTPQFEYFIGEVCHKKMMRIMGFSSLLDVPPFVDPTFYVHT